MTDGAPRGLQPVEPVSSELLRRRARSSACSARPRPAPPAASSVRISPSRAIPSAAGDRQDDGARQHDRRHPDEPGRTMDRCLGDASIWDGAR